MECETIINHRIKLGHYNDSMKFSLGCITKVYKGIHYYQRYQKNILKVLVALTLISHILADLLLVNSFLSSVKKYETIKENNRFCAVNITEYIFIVLMIISWFCQKLPLHFLLYYLAPCYTFHKLKTHWQNTSRDTIDWQLVKLIPLAVITCEIIVIAFFDRRVLTLGLVIIMLFLNNKNRMLFGLLGLLGIFSWLPSLDGRHQYTELVFIVAIINSGVIFIQLKSEDKVLLKPFLMFINIASGFCVFYTSKVSGLDPVIQVLVWFIFLSAIPTVIVLAQDAKTRVLSLLFGLEAMYSLLSLSYESLFLMILSLFVVQWIKER